MIFFFPIIPLVVVRSLRGILYGPVASPHILPEPSGPPLPLPPPIFCYFTECAAVCEWLPIFFPSFFMMSCFVRRPGVFSLALVRYSLSLGTARASKRKVFPFLVNHVFLPMATLADISFSPLCPNHWGNDLHLPSRNELPSYISSDTVFSSLYPLSKRGCVFLPLSHSP